MLEKISIIVPLFKGQKYINNIIKMIGNWNRAEQKYQIEIVFVNDYPAEPVLVENSNEDIIVKVIENEENIGIHGSRIAGVQNAAGEYVIFLDQDDTLSRDYLDSQMNHIHDREAVICNGLYRHGEKIFTDTNPLKNEYDFEEYLECGYPLVSLGQLLIKKSSIPEEWLENRMIYNGWDDHFLWAIMMRCSVKVAVNEDVLYVHEEDGKNASFSWNQMSLSGQNFKEKFLELKLMNKRDEEKFIRLIDNKISKYLTYAELSALLTDVDTKELANYLHSRGFYKIAIYGIGVYGKKLYQMLEKTDIDVLYGIDQRNDIKDMPIPVIALESGLGKVDAIVVSAVFSYESIKKNIETLYPYKVVSLMDMLREVKNRN